MINRCQGWMGGWGNEAERLNTQISCNLCMHREKGHEKIYPDGKWLQFKLLNKT